ncbi:GNAT family N-acetyltransferase [Vreelandella zhanjiangensis]|uniref:GNAT family N-acetyltransferase n=1 Tax=Vreelandella zhanjiangensis TaxID=1121960 RepID=UPI0003754CA7|nr:GNAT family N-acetyltransferase [Halomonas zhanjiangensis]
MQLILPNLEYERSYREYIQELGDEERYPFPLDFDHSDFGKLLAKLETFKNGTDLQERLVPSSTYWLVDESEILGVSNLRHHLNHRIRHAGGHIGLSIRPTQRGSGLGRHLLALTLEKALERGIHPVHIHCHKHNLPSSQMIIANGGSLESEINDGGEIIQRYVINAP